MMIPMNEMIKPTIAKPLGALKSPMNENNAPRNHTMMSSTGTQQTNNARRAKTNPAVPKPLEREP